MLINPEIIAITNQINDIIPTEKIYLFGSYAYGSPNENSDYDIYVVIPDGSMRPIEAMQKIYRSLSKTKMRIPVDVLASYASNFNERKEFSTIEHIISQEGVLLYDRSRPNFKVV